MPDAPRSTTTASESSRAELRSRLVACFAAAFPNLGPEEIPRAAVSSLPEWDSLASMTLIALIEEEFGPRAAAADILRLTSFSWILDHLREHGC
jgi:acyl carrier protein